MNSENNEMIQPNNPPQEVKHQRRQRYSGTHPRRFEEKYKELNPEKYQADVDKIIQQGKTPAGMHISIMVNEIMNFLEIQPGMTGLDATLGYGGHTQKMLEALQGQGHMYATDVDPIESEKTKARLEKLGYGEDILTIRLMNFANLDEVAPGVQYDFILADLGVSSMQIDNPSRGFTFKADGPLDLRLNPQQGITAAERLAELGYQDIIHLLEVNSDEPYAEEIAKAIMRKRRDGSVIETTRQLYDVVVDALMFLPKKEQKNAVKKSCQRVFQALRIDVNSEMEVLQTFVDKLPMVLKPGGRVAVLTFHSGEDRIVKRAFKEGATEGIYSDYAREVIRPSVEECYNNPRAHSTKMRWAIRNK